LLIPSRIDGQQALLLLDSGSDFSVIDTASEARFGLKAVKREATGSLVRDELSGHLVGMGGIGAHKLRVTTIDSLMIGPREWHRVNVGLVDLAAWRPKPSPGVETIWIDGLMGGDFLAANGALIDFAAGTVWFSPPK
jgi:hypothetical protein